MNSPLCRFVVLLFVFLVLIYSNSLTASWHLDDEPNILANQKIHLTSLSRESLFAALTANPTHPEQTKFFRPVSCLTLALNWYWSGDDTFGYHVINLAIHISTSIFLLLTLLHLLERIPSLNDRNQKYFIALLATILWASAPIQTQAVTYIIQRMASMAAMFYIAGIYAYVMGRTTQGRKRAILFFICLLLYLLAIGSKENAILLPASLLLIDICFFSRKWKLRRVTTLNIIVLSLTLTLSILFLNFFFNISISSMLSGYEHRSFTITERIYTEPRILIRYLISIFLPITKLLSIEHDVIVSTSIFSPWTTLPSFFVILLLIVGSLVYLRKHPLFCFPVLFYFLNQSIESTFIPLELFFEHRNYLPSFFIFLPLSYILARIIFEHNFSTFIRSSLVVAATLYLFLNGLATYSRNEAWANEGTLWQDALHKAPASARAAHNLGRWFRERGDFQRALRLFNLALVNAAFSPTPERTRLAALNGMASVYYLTGDNARAIATFQQCLQIKETDEACLKNIALTWTLEGQYERALTDAALLVTTYPNNPEYLYTEGFIALLLGRYEEAQQALHKAVALLPTDHKINLALGITLKKLGAYRNALIFLTMATKMDQGSPDGFLHLLETYILADNDKAASRLTKNLLLRFPVPTLIDAIQKRNESAPGLLSEKLIMPALKIALTSQNQRIVSAIKEHENKNIQQNQ